MNHGTFPDGVSSTSAQSDNPENLKDPSVSVANVYYQKEKSQKHKEKRTK